MAESKATNVVQGTVKIMSLQVFGSVAGVLAGVLVPRIMGENLFGQFIFLLSTYNIVVLFTRLGLGIIITRVFAPLYDDGRKDEAIRLYKAILSVRFVGGMLLGVGSIVYLFLVNPFNSAISALIMVGMLIFVVNVSETLFMFQWGTMRYGRWGLYMPLHQFVRVTLLPVGFFVGGVTGALAGIVFGECLISFWGWYLVKGVSLFRSIKANFAHLISLKSLVGRNFLNQVFMGLSQYLGPLLVAFFTSSDAETGIYGLSVSLVILILNSSLRGATTFSPAFSILIEHNDRSRLARWAGLAIRSGILGFLVVWGIFCFIGKPVIMFAVGEGYAPAYPLLVILLLALPFKWASGVLWQLCNIHKRPELNIIPGILELALFLGVGCTLMNTKGPIGLAIGFTLAAVISSIVSYYIVSVVLDTRIGVLRFLLLILCAISYPGALIWTGPFLARLGASLLGTFILLLAAHFTTAFKFSEFKALYDALRGKKAE